MPKGKQKALVGLDIGSKYIKAVELLSSAEGYAISGYAHKEIAPGADIVEALKDLFNSAGFSTKKVVTAVSGRPVIVRYITVPEMTDEELRNAIKYEASKYIPFEADEVVLDCQRMDYVVKADQPEAESGNKEMRVILVAAKRNLIEEHLNNLEAAGLWPYIIDVDAFALGNAFELHALLGTSKPQGAENPQDQEPLPPDMPSPNSSVALIDVGSVKTSLNIMSEMNSYFTREVAIAGNDFTDAITKKMGLQTPEAEELKLNPQDKLDELRDLTSSLVDDLVHEIQLSFDYFEHQFEKQIDAIYLSGGSSRLIGLESAFENIFQKKPVLWNPMDHIDISPDPKAENPITKEDLNRHASQLAVSIGLAARVRKD